MNLPQYCETFELKSDTCAKCKPNSFLVNSAKDCQLNPDGIPGCDVYETPTKCIKCQPY